MTLAPIIVSLTEYAHPILSIRFLWQGITKSPCIMRRQSFTQLELNALTLVPKAYWRAGLGSGWWAGTVLGGARNQTFAPASSPSVNYLGIWDRSPDSAFNNDKQTPRSFSTAAQKTLVSRKVAHATWSIFPSNITLVGASLKTDEPGQAKATTQEPVNTTSYQLDLFGQLFQETHNRRSHL